MGQECFEWQNKNPVAVGESYGARREETLRNEQRLRFVRRPAGPTGIEVH